MEPLGNVVRVRSGSTPSKANAGYWGGDRPWITARDMKSSILTTSSSPLSDAGFAVASTAPPGAVLVLTRGMTLFKKVPVCLAGADVAFNQDVKALLPMDGLDPHYLAHYLISIEHRLLSLVGTAGHGTGRLDTEALKAVEIELPPLDEQRRIARILGTWDAAIEKTGRLAEANYRRRVWLCRHLIDEPAAAGHWETRPLGDIARSVSRKNSKRVQRVLTSSARLGLVDQIEYFNKDVSGADLSDYYLLQRGEFAYNRSTSEGYPFGAIKRLDRYDEAALSTLYLCFQITDHGVSSDFLCHMFETDVLNGELGQICQAGARSHGLLNVTKAEFFGLSISLPSREVQDDIAAKLDLASREIDCMESLVGAYRRQQRIIAGTLFSAAGATS